MRRWCAGPVNPAPAAPLDAALLGLVDLPVPKDSEAMLLAGLPAHGSLATQGEYAFGEALRRGLVAPVV